MCLTWGSMMTEREREAMKANAEFERACFAQAKAELSGLTCDPITYIRKIAQRAQEIKEGYASRNR